MTQHTPVTTITLRMCILTMGLRGSRDPACVLIVCMVDSLLLISEVIDRVLLGPVVLTPSDGYLDWLLRLVTFLGRFLTAVDMAQYWAEIVHTSDCAGAADLFRPSPQDRGDSPIRARRRVLGAAEDTN